MARIGTAGDFGVRVGPLNIGGEVGSGGGKKCPDTKSAVLGRNVRTVTDLPIKAKICPDGA